MIYIVYITTNLISNNIYIGVHSQNDPYEFDGYLGSGTALSDAIKKYGTQNFVRETLFYYYNKNDAYRKEAEIVTNDFIQNEWNYNLKCGGEVPPMMLGVNNPFFGKSHSIETIQIQSECKIGDKNPMYGKTRPNHSEYMKNYWNNRKAKGLGGVNTGTKWTTNKAKGKKQSPEHIQKRIEKRLQTLRERNDI